MADDLGRPLGELRRGARVVGYVVVAVGLAGTVFFVYLAATMYVSALAGLVAPLTLLGFGGWALRHRLVLYEHGFEVFGLFSRKSLRYDQVESLAYRTVLQRVSGIDTGTYVYASMFGAGKSARFNLRTGPKEAGALERFRSRITSEIASRSLARLQSGESVPWGPDARLAQDGLYHRPKAFIGRKPEVRLDYRSGLRYGIFSGTCSIFPAQSRDVLFRLSCDAPNFFPGLALFCQLSGAQAL
jgi:hypothetical protein